MQQCLHCEYSYTYNAPLIPGACLRSDMKYEQDQDMRGSVLYPAPSKISLECLTRLRSNRTYSILARHTRVGLINPYVLTSTLQIFCGVYNITSISSITNNTTGLLIKRIYRHLFKCILIF